MNAVYAVRRGPDAALCIFFEVATLAQADSLIQHRSALQGTGTTTFEALTDKEQRQQAALWPAFMAARRAGTPAKFKRACLSLGVRSCTAVHVHVLPCGLRLSLLPFDCQPSGRTVFTAVKTVQLPAAACFGSGPLGGCLATQASCPLDWWLIALLLSGV